MEEYAIDFAKEYNAEYWSVSSKTGSVAYSTLNRINWLIKVTFIFPKKHDCLFQARMLIRYLYARPP